MLLRLSCVLVALAVCGSGGLAAQTRVHTETITPPAAPGGVAPSAPQTSPGTTGAAAPKPGGKPAGKVAPADASGQAPPPEIITDLSRLPPPVARMRSRILEAARSGDLDKVATVMQSNETMPVFSFGDDKDPVAFWKANYPDSDGIEILAILIQILETGFVHVDQGTPQEMYVWPYFSHLPLKSITPPQQVELFKFVTGSDYKEMKDFGAYIFYRLGIAPDGTWHFFVAGD